MDSMDHLITRSIRSYYKNRIYAPVIFLIFLLVLAFILPIKSLLLPKTYGVDDAVSLQEMYDKNEKFARFSLNSLFFTGYTNKWLDQTKGYYYYTLLNGECVVVLLDPSTCNQGEPTIDSLEIKAMIDTNSVAASTMLSNLATDLNWNEEGIMSAVSGYILSEPDATGLYSSLIEVFYIIFGAYSILSIVFYVLWMVFPVLSPPVLKTSGYGKPSEILAQAEEELATLPQLATEDMFITEHFFIELSDYGVALVPIDAIIWIYKYSTMHTFLWHYFSITYTLYITAGKRHNIKCPKNIKSDIDGVIDYLAEANHDILVGYSEENRLKVEEIQDDFEGVKKLKDLLSKRV